MQLFILAISKCSDISLDWLRFECKRASAASCFIILKWLHTLFYKILYIVSVRFIAMVADLIEYPKLLNMNQFNAKCGACPGCYLSYNDFKK